jgi:cytochrome c553
MRHLLANLAVYILAAGLVIGSLLFAWMRQAQIAIATERLIAPPHFAAAEDPGGFPWMAIGERVYIANCKNCHGTDGRGRDIYPPIRGQIAVFTAPGGKDYLAHVILDGLATRMHPAPMPPMPHLSDVQIAAVNNFMLTSFDYPARLPEQPPLYIPADVRRLREHGLSERDVGHMRPPVPLPRELARRGGRGG